MMAPEKLRKTGFVGSLEFQLSEFCRDYEEGGGVLLGDWVLVVEYLDAAGASKELIINRPERANFARVLLRRVAQKVRKDK